jgi:hypothetical protein
MSAERIQMFMNEVEADLSRFLGEILEACH